ncbi:hydroxyisourate hydrolase [Parvibaculum sedimenti]|uniref:5-hydroxyisourate hydrolase n=1 Tax=Parvibaculum sedimenti TaxID=2608632 RepID=A0A6N6VKJ4_9HYPH|nr:hydroxyisourate hydrolase [Parvibaculum sedimenti]KAB7741743.1 hydroxyisourate hydrolase [Parvibaculum sedimenti]
MAGKLTVHALDTARGTGTAGLRLTLRKLAPEATEPVDFTLDNGGRATLLDGAALTTGRYEIIFHAAEYQRANGLEVPEPPFLDEIPIHFGVADAGSHYHVPLILSPYGYSTYRGG